MKYLQQRLRSDSGGWQVLPGVGAWVLVAVIGLAASGVLSQYQVDVATTVCGYIALAQSWNVIAGYGGQVSLGTSAFVGVGAYSAALTAIHLHAPVVVMLLIGLAVGLGLALLLTVPLLRLRGDYFSIGTLVASLAIQAAALNWSYAGGSTGLSLPLGSLPSPVETLRLAIVVAVVSVICAWTIAQSRIGLRLRAVRDDEGAAQSLGVSGFRSRSLALAVSGALAGLAGSLIALQQISFEPTGMLGIGWTVSALLMTVVGGAGTVLGPIVGVLIVYWGLTNQLASYGTASTIIEGALLLVIVRFAPAGVWPTLLTIGRRVLPLMSGGSGQSSSAAPTHSDVSPLDEVVEQPPPQQGGRAMDSDALKPMPPGATRLGGGLVR